MVSNKKGSKKKIRITLSIQEEVYNHYKDITLNVSSSIENYMLSVVSGESKKERIEREIIEFEGKLNRLYKELNEIDEGNISDDLIELSKAGRVEAELKELEELRHRKLKEFHELREKE